MTQYQNNAIAGLGQEGMQAVGARPESSRRNPGPERHHPARRVGILGAGDTGVSIATSLLAADIPVTLYEVAREPLDKATASMRSAYQESVGNGELAAAQRDRRVALLAATVNLHHLKDCDVIVDALGTDLEAKEGLIRRLNEVARPDAVVMTGVADTGIDRFAALARFPGNVLGFRLSAGAHARQVWELVPGKATSRQALAAATRLVDNLGGPHGTALPAASSLV